MPDFRLEDAASGIAIGVDEAGRGPWAGPVSVAACWLDRSRPDQIPDGLDDSKKLTATRRADMFALLTRGPHLFNLTHVDVDTIDRMGILKATLAAMAEAATPWPLMTHHYAPSFEMGFEFWTRLRWVFKMHVNCISCWSTLTTIVAKWF